MEDCIFCKITKGEIPCYKVYEDLDYLGFLDISPLNPGNVLLIPKKHYRWAYDVPDFGRYFETARKVALAVKKAVGAESINFLTIGEEVFHAHVRIIPRFIGDGGVLQLINIKTIDKKEMMSIADKISYELK